jgi:hypothetical protein
MPPNFSRGAGGQTKVCRGAWKDSGERMRMKHLTEYMAGSASSRLPLKPLPAHGHTGLLNVDIAGLDHDMARTRHTRVFDAKSPASPYQTCAECY